MKKLQSFFVLPVTTKLQQSLVSGDAYAAVEVSSFVNVDTRHVEPEYMDFDELERQLTLAAASTPGGKLNMMLDYGALGTDRKLRMFVEEPLKKMAKDAGFAGVSFSSYFHDGSEIFRAAKTGGDADKVAEDNLGNQAFRIYPIRTELSRYLVGDFDFIVEAMESRALNAMNLLSEDELATLSTVLSSAEVAGKSLLVKLKLGDGQENLRKPPTAATRGSEPQLQLVDFLRRQGFSNIRVDVRIGHTVWPAEYRD